MTLSQFKWIFFWEYTHRMLGRLIGLVCIIPYLWFYFKQKLTPSLKLKGALIIALVCTQGLMGWMMVKSGLADIPRVSHIRLAAHLGLAFIFFGLVLWTLLEVIDKKKGSAQPNAIQQCWWGYLGLVFCQVMFGAFTAGLRGGYGYNTFPKMGEHWIAPIVWAHSPAWKNFIINPFGVQFAHRTLAWVVLGVGIGLIYWIWSQKKPLSHLEKISLLSILFVLIIQFLLGVFTLVFSIPIGLAVLHQLGAVILFSVIIITIRIFSNRY